MKKYFYLLLFFCASGFISHAQIQKGQILLGGDLNFSSSNQSATQQSTVTSRGTSVLLNPSFGKAIKDNLVAGFDLSYNHVYSTYTDVTGINTDRIDNYGAGIFLREYRSLGGRFSVFTQEWLAADFGKTSITGLNNESGNAYDFSLAFYPGIAYGICNRVQLEAGLQNLFSVNYTHQINAANSFSIGTGLNQALSNITIGCQFLLGH